MRETFTVMILGGTGVFGQRIARRLVHHGDCRVIIAGRSQHGAGAAADEVGAREGRCVALPDGLAASLGDVDLVIHTVGPFQGQDYAVAETCLKAGVHYIDLSDGRAFTEGFHTLDALARENGVAAISGASSVPGLSSTVVAHLSPAFARVDEIAMAIAPANRVPRGPAVVAAILGTVGQPMRRWQAGAWRTAHGWQDMRRRKIDGLGPRWLAACDVPDMALLPMAYPDVRTMTFHAGLELSFLHWGLWALSWPVRLGLLPSLLRFAPMMRRTARWFGKFGTDRGGMFVELRGVDAAGAPLTKIWTVIAGSGDGPWIPALPAVILARQLAGGGGPEPGARACLNLFDMDDFTRETNAFDIRWHVD